jgi:hypothetical protein
MKTVLPFALVLSLVPVAHADISVVKGEVTFNSVGIGQLMECGTSRAIEFGTMASAPYFQFRKQYEQASDDGKKPVLVEVQGALAHSSAGKLVLENPSVIALASGTCGNG